VSQTFLTRALPNSTLLRVFAGLSSIIDESLPVLLAHLKSWLNKFNRQSPQEVKSMCI